MRATGRITTPKVAATSLFSQPRVKVQLQNVSKGRLMRVMRSFETEGNSDGWISASDLALGLRRLGFSNDYVSVILKQLDSEIKVWR